jgi:hypothetical protein
MTWQEDQFAMTDEELIAHVRHWYDEAQFKNAPAPYLEIRNAVPELLRRLEALSKDKAQWVEIERLRLGKQE